MSVVKGSYQMTSLFEAELLIELMLRYWGHPLADDAEFRSALLESSSSVLRAAAAGTQIIDGLNSDHTNLIAAIWYSESISLDTIEADEVVGLAGRQAWLAAIRQALPSCFCDPDLLG